MVIIRFVLSLETITWEEVGRDYLRTLLTTWVATISMATLNAVVVTGGVPRIVMHGNVGTG